MLKTFVLAIIVPLIILGCTKRTETLNSTDINGKWELRAAQAGMIPYIEHPLGNSNIIEFNNDTYKKFENGILKESGTYSLVKDNTAGSSVGMLVSEGKFLFRIEFSNDPGKKVFIEKENNRLTLISGYFPLDYGSFMIYEKIN